MQIYNSPMQVLVDWRLWLVGFGTDLSDHVQQKGKLLLLLYWYSGVKDISLTPVSCFTP